MRRSSALVVVVAALLFASPPSSAEDDVDAVALARALPQATVSLEQGLKASGREGTPLSARYEIEGGALRLSIYTMNRDQFSEIIVDHKSGVIRKSEAIIEGADMKVATAQGVAMSRARISLEDAVGNAARVFPGYRAVGVTASLDSGHPVATTTLMKGGDVKKVIETLD